MPCFALLAADLRESYSNFNGIEIMPFWQRETG